MKVRHLPAVIVAVLLCALSTTAQAVELPAVFSDHAVFQHSTPLTIWGWSEPGSKVTVTFKDQTQSAVTQDDGRWELKLQPLEISKQPATMTVTSGDQTVTVSDILVGEVWICAGQSNMEWRIQTTDHKEEAIASANNPNIRLIDAPHRTAMKPLDRIEAEWQIASSETIPLWSAVGYHFGKVINKQLDVPVGLLSINWGGTLIEPWTSPYGFQQVEATHYLYDRLHERDPSSEIYQKRSAQYIADVEAWVKTSKDSRQNLKHLTAAPTLPDEIKPFASIQEPSQMYRGMVHAFVPYAAKGVIWYQGESNHRDGAYLKGGKRFLYLEKTRALLAGWRKAWNNPELPYYYVQIAPYKYGSEDAHILPQFWEVQAEIEKRIPHTGMVVIHDIGNTQNIHPHNKRDVGLRLANLALHDTYGKADIIARGPRPLSYEVVGSAIEITFSDVADGLKTSDDKAPSHFEIAGIGQPWVEANAEIIKPNVIRISAPTVSSPSTMRFAWHKVAEPNLANSAGLPATPFRFGEALEFSTLETEVTQLKDYTIVYDADLNKVAAEANYRIDISKDIKSFDRIAYFLEVGNRAESDWVVVTLDPFTDDVKKIGIPTASTKAFFQKPVTNLEIFANNDKVKTGNFEKGYMEFWPTNYNMDNTKKVPGATSKKYDWGDTYSLSGNYGSMQIHLLDPGSTVFAINRWVAGGNGLDIGIGSQKTGQPDWTFSQNGKNHSVKRLVVLVREK